MNFYNLFYFCRSFLPSWIRNRIQIPNPDPGPLTRLNPDPIRIRIQSGSGYGSNPDPDTDPILIRNPGFLDLDPTFQKVLDPTLEQMKKRS